MSGCVLAANRVFQQSNTTQLDCEFQFPFHEVHEIGTQKAGLEIPAHTLGHTRSSKTLFIMTLDI